MQVIEACAVAVLTSICSFCLPLLNTCTPCPDPERFPDVECPRHDTYFGNFVNFSCNSGAEYNDLATLFFNTQVSTSRTSQLWWSLSPGFDESARDWVDWSQKDLMYMCCKVAFGGQLNRLLRTLFP
jgi:hypothetical protein